MKNPKGQIKKRTRLMNFITLAFFIVFSLVAVTGAFAQDNNTGDTGPEKAKVQILGLVAAALTFGFGAIGSCIAIAHVGSAAMGAVGERPEIAGQALIFVALGEGIVIFGFITALMILGKI